jgi:hypothetical protein
MELPVALLVKVRWKEGKTLGREKGKTLGNGSFYD